MRNAACFGFLLFAACGGGGGGASIALSSPLAGLDGGLVNIGSPCTPDLERDPGFGGFAYSEVSIESSPGQPSGAPVCLAFNFQGRVSCPYGQSSAGTSDANPGCTTPDGRPVTVPVRPQCLDRRAAVHVIWSCRCASPRGATDDKTGYCACPSGTTCEEAFFSIGPDNPLAGAYCLPSRADFNAADPCAATCDPVVNRCD